MNFQKSSYWILILALLVSGLSLTPSPAQAAGQAQTVDLFTTRVIWCPAAVTLPTPNKNGCTEAYFSMAALHDALVTANPAKAGTIWLGKNYNSSPVGDVNQVFDGTQLTNMANFPLKFNGGWNGLGKGTLSTTTPTTFDGASFTVQNWKGGVTLLNIRVMNAATTGCNVLALAAVCVGTAGKIQLDRVQVADAVGHLDGVYLNNTSSVSSPASSVIVTNSLFLRNDSRGLDVRTNGAVTLKNVISGQNIAIGVYIESYVDTTASPVAITNSLFVGNSDDGLIVYSNGTVTLTGVEAQDNAGDGVLVDNTSGVANVLLQGTNTFVGNGSNGLDVATKGSVMAKNLIAAENTFSGVHIDNADFASTAKPVTISGSGTFKGNGAYGLDIYSTGPITASNLTTMSNGGGGLNLTTTLAPTDVQAVTLTNVKVNFNTNNGIDIHADGKVTLSCGTAYGNTGIGLYVRNAANAGPAASLKLQGFRSYWNNGADEEVLPTPVRTACPSP